MARSDAQVGPGQVDVLDVERGDVVVGRGGCRWEHELGHGAARDLGAARHVVVVQVRLEDEAHLDVGGIGCVEEASDVALGVDEHADPVIDQQVALVAEAGGSGTSRRAWSCSNSYV